MSVGLGNVWRFPFTALENGGGAFLIPYLIVLAVVGRPIYYLEMVIGQFSSRGSAKVYDLCPAMRGIISISLWFHVHYHPIFKRYYYFTDSMSGVGYGQLLSTAIVMTYYISLMAIALSYIFDSMAAVLPWAECQASWSEICSTNETGRISPAEYYFVWVSFNGKSMSGLVWHIV